MKKQKTIPIFVSHMGCPNDCSFCNQRKITGHSEAVTPEMADEIIKASLKTLPENTFAEIGFFGGSFTGIPEKEQIGLLEVARKYVLNGNVNAIRLSTRPDYIDEEIVKTLKNYGVTTVELGAQSMDDDVLIKNRRGHSASDTERASYIIKNNGLKLGLQMMTGLYLDTYEKSIKTAEKIISLKPDCVRIYPTLVLKGTHLDMLYKSGEYTPQSLEDAVLLCADIKEMFDKENIPVIRMGLVSSDNINPGNDVSAGPYHPAFGELVLSEIYLRKLKEKVKKDCQILVNPHSISAFVGENKKNIKKMEQWGYKITFVQSDEIKNGEFKILQEKGGKKCV